MTEITLEEINARIEALTLQRNAAQNEAAMFAGKLAVAEGAIRELRQKVEDLKPKKLPKTKKKKK